MELRDLIVTPLLLIVVYVGAYIIRPFVTDEINRIYFIPALTVRILGAIAVGFIYQFYYDGGNTFNYHTHGSRHIWEAMWDSPDKGLRLLFNNGANHEGVYEYASKIRLFGDTRSYSIIRIAAFFDLITFSSYSATAVLFSLFSFLGAWLLFQTFYSQYPTLHKSIALACLFIPSVFFWGSGILKDTVTLSSLFILTYCSYRLFIRLKPSALTIIGFLGSAYLIFAIKIYIILAFLPALILWVLMSHYSNVRPAILKLLLGPFVIVAIAVMAGWGVVKASEENPQYSLEKIGETAKITAYDIRYYSGKDAGSGYTLGELDGSIGSLVRLAPQAVTVSLFRPYLWEVKNTFMFFSALEAAFFLGAVLFVAVRRGLFFWRGLSNANVLFTIVFSVAFAFAVGVSTYNFGTLVRYKIPMLPFFAMSLILLNYYSKSERKLAALDSTE